MEATRAAPPASPRGAARPRRHRHHNHHHQNHNHQNHNHQNQNNQDRNTADGTKVMVHGYPPYTQVPDLVRVFSKFGTATVEKVGRNLTTVCYTNVEDARKAIEASGKVNVYGQFLTIKPYDRKYDTEEVKQPPPQKRDFSRTKQKSVIIAPKDIDLSGTFSEQLERVLAAVRLTQEQVAALCTLYSHLQAALQPLWPGCTAVPFGSIPTGLGIRTSDVDCFIAIPAALRPPMQGSAPGQAAAQAQLVHRAHRALRAHPLVFAETLSIPRANTPIVKFFHVPTGTNCDVTFKTPLGAQNTKLVAFLLHSDPRLLPLAVLLKYWARVHELSGTGKLTNYALTMLVVFYLQRPPLALLPSVRDLQREGVDEVLVDGWNTGFDRAPLPPPTGFAAAATVAELVGGFFRFYATFDFDGLVVCPYLGRPLRKEQFKEPNGSPAELARYAANVGAGLASPLRVNTAMCVQDPFEQCHNVALPITNRLAADIVSYFRFAAAAYERERPTECAGFLKEILLGKPVIVRGKPHPEFRVNIFPRIVTEIVTPDWKPVVRRIVRDIFESMLKIELTEAEVKPPPETAKRAPDPRKTKERYAGSITRAVWKRKQFTKLYSQMKLDFATKQAMITDEILKVDQQAIDVQFLLTVTYCNDPKSTVLFIKSTTGDPNAFREFGKFFMMVTHHWFTELLKPHTKPVEKKSPAKVTAVANMDESMNGVAASDEEDSLSLNVSSGSGDTSGTPTESPATLPSPPSTSPAAPPADDPPPPTDTTVTDVMKN